MAQLATDVPVIFTRRAWVPGSLAHKLNTFSPKSDLGKLIREMALTYRISGEAASELIDAISRTLVVESTLGATVLRSRDSQFWAGSDVEYHGIVGNRVIVTNGVGFLVDAWQNIVEMEIMKFHGLGTGTGAEASSDTGLGTELTTEYTGNIRATGTLAEGASGNIFSSVGTNTLDSGTPAVTEHGLFSASSAGTLWDRTKFSAINLDGTVGDGLTTTYQATCSAGG